jgi:hypothetical protein
VHSWQCHPEEAIKRKSQLIDPAHRALAISKCSHNLDGITARFVRCDKKRAAMLRARIFDPEPALSKFIRIFRHNDAHWINALIGWRNFMLRPKAASLRIGTNCTSHPGGVALAL